MSELAASRVLVAACGLGLAIGSNAAAADAGPSDSTPPGMVAFFMTSGTECPSGWAAPAKGQGRLLVGVTQAAAVGTTVGTPLGNETTPTHQHGFQTQVEIGFKEISGDHKCCNKQGAHAATYQVPSAGPGSTTANTADLPFIQFVLCEKQ